MTNDYVLVYHKIYDNNRTDNPYRIYDVETYEERRNSLYSLVMEGTYQECLIEETRLMDERFDDAFDPVMVIDTENNAKQINRKRR